MFTHASTVSNRCVSVLGLQVFVLSTGSSYMLSVQVYQEFANGVTCYNNSATVRFLEGGGGAAILCHQPMAFLLVV